MTERCCPNLFLVGAAKCGTTSLVHYMSQHPEIFIPARKEPQFFCTEFKRRLVDNERDYKALYRDISPSQKWAVDASTSHIYAKAAASNILEYSPEARFIFMMRDPIDMVPSFYNEQHMDATESLSSLDDAWAAIPRRKAGLDIPKLCRHPSLLFYDEVAKYAYWIGTFFRNIRPERVHFVLFEDLRKDPAAVFAGLCRFLCVSSAVEIDFTAKNPRRDIRYGFLKPILTSPAFYAFRKRFVQKPTGLGERFAFRRIDPEPLSPEMERQIRMAYEADVAQLEAILGRSLSHWLGGRK